MSGERLNMRQETTVTGSPVYRLRLSRETAAAPSGCARELLQGSKERGGEGHLLAGRHGGWFAPHSHRKITSQACQKEFM